MHVDRRFVLSVGWGVALARVASEPAPSPPPADQPDTVLNRTGDGRWAWRCWQHDGRCWRPVRGEAALVHGQIHVRGVVPAEARAVLAGLLRQSAPGHAISFATET